MPQPLYHRHLRSIDFVDPEYARDFCAAFEATRDREAQHRDLASRQFSLAELERKRRRMGALGLVLVGVALAGMAWLLVL